jgi:hypothetical protein
MRAFSLLMIVSLFMGSLYSCKHEAKNVVPAGNANTGGTGGGNTGGGTGTGGGGTGTGGGNGTGGGTTQDTSLCFERDILPIFISNCAKSGCHDAASHKEGFVFTSYQTITSKEFVPWDAEETELYEAITEDDEDKRMPLNNPPLTQQQIALIRNWINRGAPNTTNCPTICDSNKFSFANAIRPLLDKNCVGCHNGSTLAGGYNFQTYDGFKVAAQSGRLLGAIKHQSGYSPMPKGGAQLSSCEIRQVEKWIANGMLNN